MYQKRFIKTYINGNIEDIWNSVFILCDLFNETALELQQKRKHVYNLEEASASYDFLKHVYNLPKKAKEIY